MKLRKYYYFFLHIFFISGFFYAFGNFITTSRKNDFFDRRLWAYESWIVFSFYALFLFLTIMERELKLTKIKNVKVHLKEFQKILFVNLVLLIFPWGLFLIFAPSDLLAVLRLNSFYWRVLGGMSLVGALLYYFPYRFYKRKISYYILIFGAVDNAVAGAILSVLFALKKIHLSAWSAAPLLFYFANFFREQSLKYRELARSSKS